ncbi:MAG: MmcQ/YjbR family DNA-binding protein [Planctomycetota bacterium]
MTPEAFRKLALELPEAVESSHMGHPDFRVGGKIFATLGPEGEIKPWGMMKLTPEQQAPLLETEPDVFEPGPGAWGRRGATLVRLQKARVATVRRALAAAWRNTAPKKLVERFDGG